MSVVVGGVGVAVEVGRVGGFVVVGMSVCFAVGVGVVLGIGVDVGVVVGGAVFVGVREGFFSLSWFWA